MVDIKLEPHVGRHLVLHHEVRHPQDRVFADGRFIGYVTHGKPPIFSLIRPASQADIVAAIDAIQRKYGEPEFVGLPPDIPAELLKTPDEDEDE